MSAYLFILCPPYSGSTVLWKLISTSDAVSSLASEGVLLPEIREVTRRAPWNVDEKLPWKKIKEVWDGYWDHDKPLLVEKSPQHLIWASEIVAHFNPVYFLIMVRNPYAHCEGLMRRNNSSAPETAEFTVRCMRQQMENAMTLNNSLRFTYEELAGNPERISLKIQSFIPQIGDLKHTQKFRVHSIDGVIERKIIDLNQKKIKNLSVNDLRKINKILKKHADVMDYWGYNYIEPSPHHACIYYRAKISFLISAMSSKVGQVSAHLIKILKSE